MWKSRLRRSQGTPIRRSVMKVRRKQCCARAPSIARDQPIRRGRPAPRAVANKHQLRTTRGTGPRAGQQTALPRGSPDAALTACAARVGPGADSFKRVMDSCAAENTKSSRTQHHSKRCYRRQSRPQAAQVRNSQVQGPSRQLTKVKRPQVSRPQSPLSKEEKMELQMQLDRLDERAFEDILEFLQPELGNPQETEIQLDVDTLLPRRQRALAVRVRKALRAQLRASKVATPGGV